MLYRLPNLRETKDWSEMEVSIKLVGKGLQTWRTWRPEQLPFSCFSYTFGFYSSWGPACFLLSSPEASSSCEGLPAEGGKGNICGFRSLCLKTKLLTACLTFGDQLYLHPEHLGAGETRARLSQSLFSFPSFLHSLRLCRQRGEKEVLLTKLPGGWGDRSASDTEAAAVTPPAPTCSLVSVPPRINCWSKINCPVRHQLCGTVLICLQMNSVWTARPPQDVPN